MLNIKSFGSCGKRRRIASEFAAKIDEITRSEIFHASELNTRHIRLSQACMLIWQDWFTGDVDGLWTNSCLLAATYSCILLELISLGKITCKERQVLGVTAINIKVIDHELTNSYLDQATFCDLLQLGAADTRAALIKNISQAAKWKWRSRKNCATVTLRSLEEMNILKRDGECFGLRRQYRTMDLEPHGRLEKEIRMIALKSKAPDCYMRILLTLVTMADSYVSKPDKLLKRYFTKNEYTDAIERIETLTREWSPEG